MTNRRRKFAAATGAVISVLLVACGDNDTSIDAVKEAAKETVSETVAKVETATVTTESESTAPATTKAPEPAKVAAASAPAATEEKVEKAAQTGTTVASSTQPVTDETVAKSAEDSAAAESTKNTDAAPAKKAAPEKTATPKPVEKKAPALSGPHAATVAFFESMMNGKGDKAASLVSGSDAQKSAVRALSRFQKAGSGFRKRFVAEYGKEAWETFNDPEHFPEKPTSARPPFNASIPLFDSRDLEQMKLYRPKENGDEAVYPSDQGEMRLVRNDGKWRLDASTVLPTGDQDPAPAEKMMLQRAEVIERFSKAIGMANVTPDDIDVELGRAIIEARYAMKIPEPHRFDVGEITK